WIRVLHHGADADAGAAGGAVLVSALDDAVRVHVPVPGHAGLGADDRRGGTADARAAHLPRDSAEGKRAAADLAGSVADAAVRTAGGRGRGEHVPRDAGLGLPTPAEQRRGRVGRLAGTVKAQAKREIRTNP